MIAHEDLNNKPSYAFESYFIADTLNIIKLANCIVVDLLQNPFTIFFSLKC